jgi:DNA uptake protein ComE-like DNA-binding protein
MLDRPRPWWVLWSLVPFGWLAWIGMVYAGARARMPLLIAVSFVFLATTIASFAFDGDTGVVFAIAGYVGGIGASLAFVPAWQRRMRQVESHPTRALDAASERLAAREQALELARSNPELAREAGVGRPDIPGAAHGGVVDLNAAPVSVLSRLPGIDDDTAVRIATVREEIDGFTSLVDLGSTLDLPADAVEDLRGRVVFIPR